MLLDILDQIQFLLKIIASQIRLGFNFEECYAHIRDKPKIYIKKKIFPTTYTKNYKQKAQRFISICKICRLLDLENIDVFCEKASSSKLPW